MQKKCEGKQEMRRKKVRPLLAEVLVNPFFSFDSRKIKFFTGFESSFVLLKFFIFD